MQSASTFNYELPSRPGRFVSNLWPVWKDSVRAEVTFTPVPKKKVQQLWFKARRWDQETRQRGKQGGIIGRTALAVLYVLTHDFLNFRTGRLDPSVQAIARKASICARTCHTALQRLRNLGVIDWLRRCSQDYDAEGRFLLRQSTNAYHLQTDLSAFGPKEIEPPTPSADTLGLPPPYPTNIETATTALREGNLHAAFQSLTADKSDPLALALAELGRAMGRF